MGNAYVTVDGMGRLDEALGMVALDGWSLSPPEVRTRMVEVPGRSGSLDLTEAMGGPYYKDRLLTLRFLMEGDPEACKSRALAALHGRRFRFSLSMDQDHAYEGRWEATETDERWVTGAVVLTFSVACDPYRSRRDVTLRLNPAGGREYWLESGDMPVRPTVECRTVTLVEWSGESFELTPGTHVLRGEPMRRGLNRIWLNSWQSGGTTMGYLSGLTMGELSRHRMAELRRLARDSGVSARPMGELSLMGMGELSQMTMREMRWGPSGGEGDGPGQDTTVIVTYEWGDL